MMGSISGLVVVVWINADEQSFFAKHAAANANIVARLYLLDRENPSSIQTSIQFARENARTLRALISTEMWLQMNIFHAHIRGLGEADIQPAMLSRLCAMLRDGTQAHTGVTEVRSIATRASRRSASTWSGPSR